MTQPLPIANIDAADGDWLKRGAWDIWLNGKLIDNAPDMREWLYNARISIDEFKAFEVYLSHVKEMPWLADL